MDNSPEKRSEWRAIFYVQARVAILFVPLFFRLLTREARRAEPDAAGKAAQHAD